MPLPLTDTALARLLNTLTEEEEFIFLETTRITEDEDHSYLFLKPTTYLLCHADDDPDNFFQRANAFLKQGYYLAGWLAYEFGYLLEPALAKLKPRGSQPLACFGVFPAPHIYEHGTGTFKGAGPWPLSTTAAPPRTCSVERLRPNLTQADYIAALAHLKRYIESGDTYQVNYTFKLLFDLAGSPEALYTALRRNQSVSFGAYLRRGEQRMMSFSPELFFKKKDGRCTVRPMKGTVKRGRYPKEDHELARFLKHDSKNRSENVMIVDLLRNDLGRICRSGSVRTTSLFDVETYETLHQMTSSIEGMLPAETPLSALFRALFPCGSVTGAPKIRTMEIIRELEKESRGVYTGAIGFIAPSGQATFNVPIRTLRLAGKKGEMGIGSGVVYDSDPHQEWQECLLKGRFLSEPALPFLLIETMLWRPESGFWLLGEHLDRLEESARHFLYPCDREKIVARLSELAARFSQSPMRVRLTLAKDGELSLVAGECASPAPLHLPPARLPANELPRVRFSKSRTDPASSHLYHKTTLRDLYDAERHAATAEGCYEVLFTNTRGEVTEGSISNIFIQTKDAFQTPPVECGLLNGVLRRHLIEHSPLPVREAVLTRQDLEQAEAIYLGNSVRGLLQVRLQD
ncbi:aminodeoxychorismate synthase component I [Thiovibrio sp. JS02]